MDGPPFHPPKGEDSPLGKRPEPPNKRQATTSKEKHVSPERYYHRLSNNSMARLDSETANNPRASPDKSRERQDQEDGLNQLQPKNSGLTN